MRFDGPVHRGLAACSLGSVSRPHFSPLTSLGLTVDWPNSLRVRVPSGIMA
jgi:hypothetical protein